MFEVCVSPAKMTLNFRRDFMIPSNEVSRRSEPEMSCAGFTLPPDPPGGI